MRALQKVGGIAALIAAATFVVGLVMFATVLIDYTTADDARDAVAFLVDDQVPLYAWNLLITIVFGVALVPLSWHFTGASRTRRSCWRGPQPSSA